MLVFTIEGFRHYRRNVCLKLLPVMSLGDIRHYRFSVSGAFTLPLIKNVCYHYCLDRLPESSAVAPFLCGRSVGRDCLSGALGVSAAGVAAGGSVPGGAFVHGLGSVEPHTIGPLVYIPAPPPGAVYAVFISCSSSVQPNSLTEGPNTM